ncbi:uncharacterized protein [Apostichopus japonicus]
MGGTSSSSQPTQIKTEEDTRFESFLSCITDDDTSSNAIDKNKFINSFPSEVKGFAECFINQVTSQTNVPQVLACRQAFQRIANLSTSSAQATFYLSLCKSHDETLREDDCFDLFRAAYYFYCQTSSVKIETSKSADEESLKCLVATISLQKECDKCVTWIDQNCPEIFSGLHLWLLGVTTSSLPKSETILSESIPSSCILNGVLWWLLSASLPSDFSQPSKPSGPSTEILQHSRNVWASLYSSNEHGLSVNRFQHHVFAYRGPTVFLVSCSDGCRYALAVDVEWRDGTTPWGGQNSFFIQISPFYKIVEEGEKMVLFNEKSRNIPKGLFIGRDRSKYSLKITEGFQSVEHGGQSANLLDVEVWGCGGGGAKVQQMEQKKREKRDTEKNAKVKLPGEWDQNPDRLLLEWGGVRPSYGDQFKADFGPDARS